MANDSVQACFYAPWQTELGSGIYRNHGAHFRKQQATSYGTTPHLAETAHVIGSVLHKPVRKDPLALVRPQPDGCLLRVHRARRRLLAKIEVKVGE